MPTATIDATIAHLASSTFGVVTADRLRAAGISRSCVARRVADGRLVVMAPGIYLVGGAPRSWEARATCALARSRGASALSHGTAAERLCVWDSRRGDGTIHVTGSPGARLGCIGDTVYHRTAWFPPNHLLDVGGLATTTCTRTVCDLGTVFTAHQVTAVLREAQFLRLLDLSAIEHELARRGRQAGVAVVRRAIELHRAGSAGTRSRTEDHLLTAVLLGPLPEPCVNVRGIAGTHGVEPDLTWVRLRLIVEIDGSPHDAPHVAEGDRGRDELLRANGWHVIRFTADDVWKRRAQVVREIVALVQAGPID